MQEMELRQKEEETKMKKIRAVVHAGAPDVRFRVHRTTQTETPTTTRRERLRVYVCGLVRSERVRYDYELFAREELDER